MACGCKEVMRTAPAGWPALRPGGAADCSAFPPELRARVAETWEPVARVMQVLVGFQVQMLPSLLAISGPFAVVVGPLIALGTLLSITPYIAMELLINCNPSEQVKRQSAMALDAMNVADKALSIGGIIPGSSEIRRALALARPFLQAGAAGQLPSVDAVAKLVSAGDFAGSIGDVDLGFLTGALEFLDLAPKASSAVGTWSAFADANERKLSTDAKALAETKKKRAIALAKAKAKAEAVANAKQRERDRLIDEAKAKAKASAIDKAKAAAVEAAALRASSSDPSTATSTVATQIVAQVKKDSAAVPLWVWGLGAVGIGVAVVRGGRR